VLAKTGNVRLACQKAGVTRSVAYAHKERGNGFAEQWDEALQQAVDLLEQEAWRRARATSDVLLIFLLKAHRPEMYRETTRHEVTGKDGTRLNFTLVLGEHDDDSGA
jgi:hypothetical protein